MGAGRNIKPIKQHLIDGTYRSDRHNKDAIFELEFIPDLPEWYSEEAKKIFMTFAEWMNSMGLLTIVFIYELASMSTFIARHNECERKLSGMPVEKLIVNVSTNKESAKQLQYHPLQRLSWKYLAEAKRIAKDMSITPQTFVNLVGSVKKQNRDDLMDLISK